MVRETRHLWVGNLPEHVREEKIVEHFKRYGRVESVKVLRKRGSEGGVAAFVDFVDIKSAQKAHNAVNKMGDRDLRTDYNEPGSVPSAVRGLDDNSPSSSHTRDVSGFSRGAVGPVYGPPVSLHTREGRYERRLDGSSDSRDRAYEHSPYGHHERGSTFDRPRHYNTDYYRDRTMFASGVSSSPAASTISGGFDTPETHFESRIRDPFSLSSAARRDPYRDDRGRRVDRTYHHRRSRSSHSSQSRHPSPQRTTGQTPKAPHSPKRAPVSPSRGPRSRSHSRSSSSDSVGSTSSTGSGSSDSNSSSSEGSRARSVQSAATHVPPAPPPLSLDSDEPRRSFGIRVQNLPVRSTDTSLKDGLFHEFKKYGKVTSVQIHGASEERYGLVFFRQQEDQEKALSVSKGKLFFGMLIEVTAWNGPETESENEFRPLDGRIDEFHPKATRTLFIGNLEKTTNYQQLLDVFQRFGEIVDIDIKRVNGVPQYAFVQYSDIASVCKAIKKMDGEYLGTNRLKLGFGKSMPTTCVWLDGLASSITEQYLTRHFCRYGHVVKVVFDRLKGMALILYNNTEFAQAAVRETKGWKIGGNKIKVDFASQESQMAFYRSMQASGQDIRDFYEIPSERRDDRRPPYHDFSAERAYYENVRTPGLYAEDPRRDYSARSRERYTELDHYQGDHYDPRYHDDPREYRDYRDPFEQDIRKYSYIQRERERERERFEADRSRWSPSHQRRPITPATSPSPSERVSREAERRVYRHSSERSGSCSSLSPPPQYEKSDKSPIDYKNEGLDREMEQIETERMSGAERSKRARRKEKADKEKGEKLKSRRGKVQSPSVPHAETDREASLDASSGKLKASDFDGTEKQRHKGDGEPSPADQISRLEPQKGERLDQVKSDTVDRDGKGKTKKHLKSDSGIDGKDSVSDPDRLAARKRRFGDPSGKAIRQKRGRLEEESSLGLNQSADSGSNSAFAKDTEVDVKMLEKEGQKKEHSKSKPERLVAHYGQREEHDPSSSTAGRGQGLMHPGEISEVDIDTLDPAKSHPGSSVSRRLSNEGGLDKDSKVREDYMSLDIDLSQSYRKQMEQNRRLRQQMQESDKPGRPGTPQSLDTEDFEHRSLVHEVGKPPQDVTDNSPSNKNKKQESFDLDLSSKRERVYRSSRQKSEDSEWNHPTSPRLLQASLNTDEEYNENPHALTGKDIKEPPKPEDNAHSELHAVKRVHASHMSKLSTPLQDEQQKRWDARLKQDLLPDLGFSSSSGKRRLNRKYLDYGLWHDLEPGEVRSDSEEDRENKPNSPMPSTSVSFSERHRVDRMPESKLSTSSERNKFYSFALDQKITPDTKALLERAKSLSSSREDNWSFLDCDSHFASFRSRKDTEKVESTPRPTPSWYMKKKKIRSESEDKLDDRKEDPKPEEQERRELFASRFLHSSIFEQDSRRLQHLERKHEDPEHGLGYHTPQQGATEPDSEPVVLFHSRFLELTRLQQQKEKDQSQQEIKRSESIDGNRIDKPQEDEEKPQQQLCSSDHIQEPEIKPVSPSQVVQNSQPLLMLKETSPPLEKASDPTPSPPSQMPLDVVVKEEEKYVPTSHPLVEESSTAVLPECKESKSPVTETKLSPNSDKTEVKGLDKDIEHFSGEVTQTNETPKNCLEQKPESECEPPELPCSASASPMLIEEMGSSSKTESVPVETKIQLKDEDQKVSDNYAIEEPVSPPQKSKTKKKVPPATPVTPLTQSCLSDKQAVRKSERIDREKLKRSSSPRGESSKAIPDSKSTSKSPIHGPEAEPEQNVPPVRARRRNVRSVYATPVEDESAQQTSKDVESPRPARKRTVGDKDIMNPQPSEQESLTPPQRGRGRPPKNRRQGEDVPAAKCDRAKATETKETDINDLGNNEGVTKTEKGKNSSHTQKGTYQGSALSTAALGKKGDKTEKIPENTKLVTEDKSLVLKNLRVRLDVTEVKAMLQSGDDDSGHDDSPKKNNPSVSTKDSLDPSLVKDVLVDNNESKDKALADSANTGDPQETLLSQQMELEQAVEHISKLTEDTTPLQFKNVSTEQPVPLPELEEVPERETEEEKPANPASETELAAAIDSITNEDVSCPVSQDPVIGPVMDTDPDIQTLIPDSKVVDPGLSTASEEVSASGTPRKGGKGRGKSQKRPKAQKGPVGRKEFIKETVLETETMSVKSPGSMQANLQVTTEGSSPPAATVVPPPPKQDMTLTGSVTKIPKELDVPPKDQSEVLKSSGHTGDKSPVPLKPQQLYDCASPSSSLSPSRPCLKQSHPVRLPVSPTDRHSLSKEAGVLIPPVTSAASVDNPALTSDLSDHDPDTTDLRKILSKPKSVPSSDVSGTHGKEHTHSEKEGETQSDIGTTKSSPPDNKQPSLSAQPVVRPPASLPSHETKQVFGEKSVISVIASTGTSVISRICNPPDTDEKSNITMVKPFMDKQAPKQKYQAITEDSGQYHGPSVGEEGGNAGRYVVESTPLSTGSSPGLRVNTPEGVVVLSHSGQKKEGPHRISAKISQIPPASAVDLESQHLVSMPQIKQDLYTASQPTTPKCPIPPSDHGHSLKTQPTVSSIKQESTGLDKLDSPYPTGQSGVVKRLQPSAGCPQVMGYADYTLLLKHTKKGDGPEPLNVDPVKPAWATTISPHLPSPSGNHVAFMPSTPTERAPSHLSGAKQEPRSPRKSGHPHSPFVSSPIGSSSPKAVPVVLAPGMPSMSQYVPSVHHSEQSVIMPPHSTHGSLGRMSPHRVSQTIPMGHLSQGEGRVNTPPLQLMSYGIHSESLTSPWSGTAQQRPTSPTVGNREMVLKVNPSSSRSHESGEEEARRFHPALGRSSTSQLKPETIQSDYRGTHSGLALERFNMSQIPHRDMRLLMHHQQGDRAASELLQGHGPENAPSSSTSTSITSSLSPRAHLVGKGLSDTDPTKALEVKRPSSPNTKEGIIGSHGAVPAMASPQRVQLLPSGTGASFSEYPAMYTNMRVVHAQFTEGSPMGINPAPTITSGQGSQDAEPSHTQTDGKVEQAGLQVVNMMQLLTKYPIVWQGLLAIKNDSAAVQLHFVCGNKALALRSLPLPEGGALLRIAQRMRLEASQLESVARRMTGESEFCLLLALPCGRDQEDVLNQTQALKSAFINYLQAKLAAGIINVPNPGSNQPAYVLQIFPPCEFSESHLSRLAPDLLNRVSNISPHLMIVITSV
ncbi:msx2-interacting protein [Chanos chanos]|uniref:Msx2-interacting protein n=1 Tax=Chanos chanos TaxID=29144 RepID=A0A6J2VKA0_CHACN|nr:msx2-interacting protein-like [Chanos chanos]